MAVLNRRNFIKTMGLGAAAFAFPGCVSEKGKNKVTGIVENPNVLFISIDDLNDWIEPLGGHPQAKTPNLKRLAGQGVPYQVLPLSGYQVLGYQVLRLSGPLASINC